MRDLISRPRAPQPEDRDPGFLRAMAQVGSSTTPSKSGLEFPDSSSRPRYPPCSLYRFGRLSYTRSLWFRAHATGGLLMATIPSIDAGESVAAASAPPVRPCLDHIVTEDDTPVDNMFSEKEQRL